MKLDLPPTVMSPQDLKAIIFEIRKYAQWFGQDAVRQRVAKAAASQPPIMTPPTLALIEGSANKTGLTQNNLDQLIAALEKYATDSPHVVITTAAIAPVNLKTAMVTWCRQHIAANVLVDFRFNSTLLGGLVIQTGSHVYDWSFRRQILTSSVAFAEVLRRV
jgi:hypothetical protein